MLSRLNIRNYALIEDIEVDLAQGLTSMTGETGAGKSIILGAISLLTGNRADLSSIRKADKKCIIEAEFNLENLNLKSLFESLDLDYQKDTIIRREISKDGKSRVFINDSPAVLLHLKQLMRKMLDVHSQHENLELNNRIYQLQSIDLFAGNGALLNDFKLAYSEYQKAKEEYNELVSTSEKLRENTEYLSFQLNELLDADLKNNEQEELEQEQSFLGNTEEIRLNLQMAEDILNDSDNNPIDIITKLSFAIKKVSIHIKDFEELEKRIESILIELEDISREITNAGENTNFDPERAQFIEDRLSLIYRLQQKHRVGTDVELIELRDRMEGELENIQNLDERLNDAEKKFKSTESICFKIAEQLNGKRSEAKIEFEKEVIALLKRLGMPDCRFVVDLKSNNELGTDGFNTIDFLFSANKGVEERPLSKVASGGELSRLMLSIKAILAKKSELPTVIFDEIDTGISGEIAEKMGKIIREMSLGTQVLVITHLPQIAALGQEHIRVFKDSSGASSQTRIKKLNREERMTEIARLLSGEDISQEALDNAKVMMGASLSD